MEFIITLSFFILVVIILPILINLVSCHFNEELNGIGWVFFALLFVAYLITGISMGTNQPKEWVDGNSFHLISITDSDYVKTTISRYESTNQTESKYDYTLNQPSGIRTFSANKNNSSIKLKDGALDLETQHQVYIKNFAYKYIIPKMFMSDDNLSSWNTFYVDPQYAKDKLNIEQNNLDK